MDTRQKILGKSLVLFNNRGVENVTTRHIAHELGISQGNLHYHYPKKNEILLALFEQFLVKIETSSSFIPENTFSREDVLSSLALNFKIMAKYRLFFHDNEIIWRRVPEIKDKTILLMYEKKEQIKVLIHQFKAQGLIKEEFNEHHLEHLSDLFLYIIASWLPTSIYMGFTEPAEMYFKNFVFRIWFPYFKVEEMNQWEKLLT